MKAHPKKHLGECRTGWPYGATCLKSVARRGLWSKGYYYGSAGYNQALSERRVARAKNFLVEQGVPAANIQTQALGDQHNLTPAEVKEQVDTNPDLTQEEKDRISKRMQTIIWASNRRVDISLNGSGQQSARHLPFHAEDALTIIGGRTSEMKTAPRKK